MEKICRHCGGSIVMEKMWRVCGGFMEILCAFDGKAMEI